MDRKAIIHELKRRLDATAGEYAKYRNSTTNLGLRRLIESLLEQEREYLNELEEIGTRFSAEDILSAEAESSPVLQELLEPVTATKPATDLEILKILLEVEKRSMVLFGTLSDLAGEEDAGYLFRRMGDEEKKHISWIQDRIDLLELGG